MPHPGPWIIKNPAAQDCHGNLLWFPSFIYSIMTNLTLYTICKTKLNWMEQIIRKKAGCKLYPNKYYISTGIFICYRFVFTDTLGFAGSSVRTLKGSCCLTDLQIQLFCFVLHWLCYTCLFKKKTGFRKSFPFFSDEVKCGKKTKETKEKERKHTWKWMSEKQTAETCE